MTSFLHVASFLSLDILLCESHLFRCCAVQLTELNELLLTLNMSFLRVLQVHKVYLGSLENLARG